MKNISVFTGNRAEYGLLRYLIKEIDNSNLFNLQLIVGGAHFSSEYGNTIDEIKIDNIKHFKSFSLPLDKDKEIPTASLTYISMGKSIDILKEIKCDLIFILGDRYETFAMASAAYLLGIPIAHLHGGESSYGSLDDKLRHAITQLSTWHFTSAEKYKNKVISMVDSKKNVFKFGPMIIDGFKYHRTMTHEEFHNLTGYKFGKKNLLITFHPETLTSDYGLKAFKNLLLSLEKINSNFLFTYPNSDTGSKIIIEHIKSFSSKYKEKSWVIKSLGHKLYISALKLFDAMIGNSSSGIIEAPIIGIPVLNIGNRQEGREKDKNFILDVDDTYENILDGLKVVLERGVNNNKPRKFTKSLNSPSSSILSWLENQIM